MADGPTGRNLNYLAVFWGVAIIGFSGLVLWFPVMFTKIFPGWLINVSQIIHSDEALLAVGFIFTIHFFNTHFRPRSLPDGYSDLYRSPFSGAFQTRTAQGSIRS
jgi:cytochrome b subunit of formate dehydrogenase